MGKLATLFFILLMVVLYLTIGALCINMINEFERKTLAQTPDVMGAHETIKYTTAMARMIVLIIVILGIVISIVFCIEIAIFSTNVNCYERFIYHKLDLYNQR